MSTTDLFSPEMTSPESTTDMTSDETSTDVSNSEISYFISSTDIYTLEMRSNNMQSIEMTSQESTTEMSTTNIQSTDMTSEKITTDLSSTTMMSQETSTEMAPLELMFNRVSLEKRTSSSEDNIGTGNVTRLDVKYRELRAFHCQETESCLTYRIRAQTNFG